MRLTNIELNHLIFRRTLIFFDEWLTYALLIYLYINEFYLPLSIASISGIYAIYISYYNLSILRKRYGVINEI